jgi:hypothetical protein
VFIYKLLMSNAKPNNRVEVDHFSKLQTAAPVHRSPFFSIYSARGRRCPCVLINDARENDLAPTWHEGWRALKPSVWKKLNFMETISTVRGLYGVCGYAANERGRMNGLVEAESIFSRGPLPN